MDAPDLKEDPGELTGRAIGLMIFGGLIVWSLVLGSACRGARAVERECRMRGGFPEWIDAYTVNCHIRPGNERKRASMIDLE